LKYSQNSLQVEGVAVYLLVENRDYWQSSLQVEGVV
jgi:hypothetical protein